MKDPGKIELLHDGSVSILKISRPEKLNALNQRMVNQLHEHCLSIDARQSTRSVILTGAGSTSFCAGGDISAWSGLDARSFGRKWVRDGHRALDALANLRLPLIAVLNGHVFGGGIELAACADYRIGEEHATFSQPEAGLGIIPGWSGTQRAVRRFGSQAVRRMALFGETFDSRSALRHGLVDEVVPTGAGMRAAAAVAARINDQSPLSTELVKMLINIAEDEETERPVEAIAGMMAAGSSEMEQSVSAFWAKKKPGISDGGSGSGGES